MINIGRERIKDNQSLEPAARLERKRSNRLKKRQTAAQLNWNDPYKYAVGIADWTIDFNVDFAYFSSNIWNISEDFSTSSLFVCIILFCLGFRDISIYSFGRIILMVWSSEVIMNHNRENYLVSMDSSVDRCYWCISLVLINSFIRFATTNYPLNGEKTTLKNR